MARVIRRTLLVALLFIVVPAAWLGYQVHAVYTEVRATYHPAPRIPPELKATPVTNFFGSHRINILLLGSDNDAKFVQRYPLTQSMIVVSIDPVHDTVNMLSVPRDFWVPIPGVGYGKIDTAAELGGVSLARATVEALFNINIDYYAWVGLSGFSRVVDDFGGVTVNITHPILDDFYPNDQGSANPYSYERLFIPPGWRHLSGRQALEYVRSRHGDLTGDFGRSERQQQVLLQLRRRATGWNLLFKIPELASTVSGMLRTDLSPTRLLDLARLSRRMDASSITRVVLSAPTYCTADTTSDGQNVLDPNWQAITPVVRRLFAPINTAQAPTPTSAPRPLAAPLPSPAPQPTPNPGRTVITTHGRGSIMTTLPGPRPTATPVRSRVRLLPSELIYAAGGTFYRMDREGRTTDIMPSWMTAADMPSLAADGRSLAFMRWATDASNIDVYDLKTRQTPKQITSNAPSDPATISNGVWAAWPSWSADGKMILFSSDRYKLQSFPEQSRQLDLAIDAMNSDGSNIRQLTHPALGAGGDTDPQVVGKTRFYLYDHWAYPLQNGLGVGQPYSRLMIGNLDHLDRVTALTPPSGQIMQPTLDRSGQQIAYLEGSTNSSRLVVAHLSDGKNGFAIRDKKVIATGEIAEPSFTPDGRSISFLQADGSGFSIYLESSRGGAVMKLDAAGNGVDAISRPIWVP